MATLTVYANEGAYIQSTSSSYASAADGTGTLEPFRSSQIYVGQQRQPDYYRCYELFLEFNISGISSASQVQDANLIMFVSDFYNHASYTVVVSNYDWGGTIETSDWRNRTQLTNLYNNSRIFTVSDSSLVDQTFITFNKGTHWSTSLFTNGTKRFIAYTNRHKDGTAPPSAPHGEYAFFANYSSGGTPYYPRLVITYTPAGGIKRWNGSTWVKHPVKVWNGSSWVSRPVKVWDGSQWVRRA